MSGQAQGLPKPNSKEFALMIKFMAQAQWSMALQLARGQPRSRYAWMSRPHPGDLVVETTTLLLRETDVDGLGILQTMIDTGSGGRSYEIIPLHRKVEKPIRWTNCTFIRPIYTADQESLLSDYNASKSDVYRRAHMIPWCSTQPNVSYERTGHDPTSDAWLFRCRGCGHETSRRRFLDPKVPPCPKCHVPTPTVLPCTYCEARL